MRLSQQTSEIINREKPVAFTFEGKKYQGFEGDTITSALLANGVKILGRSFKYHRPRSVLSFANHDMNVIVDDVSGQYFVPNIRADVTKVIDGMKLKAVNTFGGVENDKASILGRFSKFLPVGFYYKAFHTKALFPMWEKMFRAMTGLGNVDFKTPKIKTAKDYGFCDCLVVGAGVAGLSAAISAAENGLDVVLVDENSQIGGSINYTDIPNELIERAKAANIRILSDCYAAGYYADNWVALVHKTHMTKMRAKTVIVASGAFEQPPVFRNNDLPNIMLAGAFLRLLKLYSVKIIENAVFLVANDYGYETAKTALANGINIKAIVDLRNGDEVSGLEEFVAKNIPVYTASCIYEAVAGKDKRVESVKIHEFNDGIAGALKAEIACDGVVMATGFAPALNLLYQANTKMRFDDALSQFIPDLLLNSVFACGKLNGKYSYETRVRDGEIAGISAANFVKNSKIKLPKAMAETQKPNHPWPIIEHEHGKNFVDFDEDLQLKDFKNAVQEGFDNIVLLKRYTTNGMGPSQGKHSNMNGLRILARLTGKPAQEVGTTTARPFYHPVPMKHLGGRGFSPNRVTPLHSRHGALDAVFMLAGNWQRPEYYARDGISRQNAINAEVMAVHDNVGIIDVGTLGKLEVIGPDAAEFLERVYISKYKGLKIGNCRYGVACDETGVVVDDGIIARLADNHFYFTTTTSGAANIYRELSRLNMIWGLDCGIVNHTGSFGAINLAGPNSKAVLAKSTDLDLDDFPFMGYREALVAGVKCRIIRAGFVGELGYEIHAPALEIHKIWDEFITAGATPFGVEAQRVLRLQKGHIIIGQDTDGLSTPYNAALDWALKMDKPFFVGKRSLEIIAKKPKSQVLAGFALPKDYEGAPPQECHLIIENGDIAGRITSITKSPRLGQIIGLCHIKPELAAIGSEIKIRFSNGSFVAANIVNTPFYDPENLNQKGVAK